MKYILLFSTLFLSACAMHKSPSVSQTGSPVKIVPESNLPMPDLIAYARSLIGTPYKYGGTSPDSGFDCSGYVGDVFQHTAGVRLPRSSSDISKKGSALERTALQPGDLVFFNTLKKKFSHVGIYLGDNQFIHAPSNSGKVRIDDMTEPYWKKSYDGARRISAPQ